ncbi:MAG: hypothetical protein RRB13_16550 [bacterium]|nr:hypothetical protein [bacterium]
MSYLNGSNWNDLNEMRCLLIYLKLKSESPKRGAQQAYCQAIEQKAGISSGSLSSKVSDYSKISGGNRSSHFSQNTQRIFEQFGHFAISEVEKEILRLETLRD